MEKQCPQSNVLGQGCDKNLTQAQTNAPHSYVSENSKGKPLPLEQIKESLEGISTPHLNINNSTLHTGTLAADE